MATNFPTSLDNLTNPAGSDPVNNPSHATQHANINDAIENLEAKVGVNNSAVTTSLDYRVKQLETNPVASYTDEEARNAIGTALTGSGGITVTPNNVANTITVSTDNTIATKTYVDTAVSNIGSTAASTYVPVSEVGQADGIATLDATGQVPFSQLGNLVASAPATLDTLNELATALGNDANFATTTATSIGNKVSKAGGDVIEPSSASVTGLTIKGAVSQTANLQQWLNSSGDLLGRFHPTAGLLIPGVANTGGGAAPFMVFDSTNFSLYTNTASNKGLVIRGAASQTASLMEWQNSAGNVLSFIGTIGQFGTSATVRGSTGGIFGGIGQLSSAGLTVYATAAGNPGAIVRGAASQTANLMEFQNSAGTAITFFNASGGLTATEGVISTLYSGGKMTTGTLGYYNATTFNPSVIPVVVRGASSQAADLQQWQDSTNAYVSSVGSNSAFKFMYNVQHKSTDNYPRFYFQVNDWSRWDSATYHTWAGNNTSTELMRLGATGGLTITGTTAANIGLIVKGAASQSANLQEWQDSTGAIVAAMWSSGTFSTAGRVSIGNGSSGAKLDVLIASSTQLGLVVKGVISQTANLQEWQNSAGTVLSKVDASGAMFTTTAADSTNTTQVATTAYVKSNINNLINAAPGTLDTLGEIATALAASDSAAAALVTSVNLKAPLASPDLTGTPTAPTAVAGTNTTQLATTAFVKTELSTSIQPGALYQTSAPSSPAVGQIWIDSDEDVTTFDPNIIRRKAITATAGQTVFTADLPFIDGFEQIFMNGLLLVKTTDYATSGGNTVTLTSAAAVSDVIEIVSVTGANSVSTYTQSEVNALLAANTSVAPLSISANTTLVAKKRYFVTSASALTLTLPASPALNDEIQIVDASGNASTYNITVARNANKINGGTGNLIIDNNGGWYTLLYTGATYGWKVG